MMIDQGLAPLSVIYRTFGAFSPDTNNSIKVGSINSLCQISELFLLSVCKLKRECSGLHD